MLYIFFIIYLCAVEEVQDVAKVILHRMDRNEVQLNTHFDSVNKRLDTQANEVAQLHTFLDHVTTGLAQVIPQARLAARRVNNGVGVQAQVQRTEVNALFSANNGDQPPPRASEDNVGQVSPGGTFVCFYLYFLQRSRSLSQKTYKNIFVSTQFLSHILTMLNGLDCLSSSL